LGGAFDPSLFRFVDPKLLGPNATPDSEKSGNGG
jgi:hypothetical protein